MTATEHLSPEQFKVVDLYPRFGPQHEEGHERWSAAIDMFRAQHAHMVAGGKQWRDLVDREDIGALARDMATRGQQVPIKVQHHEGKDVITEGHHRAAAAFWMHGSDATILGHRT